MIFEGNICVIERAGILSADEMAEGVVGLSHCQFIRGRGYKLSSGDGLFHHGYYPRCIQFSRGAFTHLHTPQDPLGLSLFTESLATLVQYNNTLRAKELLQRCKDWKGSLYTTVSEIIVDELSIVTKTQ